MTTAKTLAETLATKLAEISTDNGYETDVGTTVMRGRRQLDESHLPCIVIIEGADQVVDSTRSIPRPGARNKMVKLSQRYIIEAHLACDADNPSDAAHDAIGDLKKCVFADVTLAGAVRDIEYVGRAITPRDDGVPFVCGAIEIALEFTEDLTSP